MIRARKIFSPLHRQPDFYIGGRENPYMRRWWLTERDPKKWRIYLHHIMRDDDDRALHDHPSCSISIILRAGYIEHLPGGVRKRRYPGMVIFRRADHAHRLDLRRDRNGDVIAAWTLFIFGPKVREWGFHCPRGWRHWRDFVAETDSGNVGKGCD